MDSPFGGEGPGFLVGDFYLAGEGQGPDVGRGSGFGCGVRDKEGGEIPKVVTLTGSRGVRWLTLDYYRMDKRQ